MEYFLKGKLMKKIFVVAISILVLVLLSGLFFYGCSNPVTGSELDNKNFSKWFCTVKGCKYVYDPEVGDPTQGIPPGTSFEDLPSDWKCPVCEEGKDKFIELDK